MNKELLGALHNMAMDNAELAIISMRNGDFQKFSELSAKAFLYEKKAALHLYNERVEPSRSVLFRSAAYLALDNADFNEAYKLYEFAMEGNPHQEILEELDELRIEIDRVKTENEKYIEFVIILLKSEPRPISTDALEKAKSRAITAFKRRDINLELAGKYLSQQYNVDSDRHTVLEEPGAYEPWINQKKGITPKPYWNRYVQFLNNDERLALDTIDKLDNITDDILDHLRDPKSKGDWDKRGMVVGQVQSGKTSNYVGLICKAADYGYRIIVILAGMSNDLRSQTQFRIDQGFLGKDTKIDRSSQEVSRDFGVAKYDNTRQAHPVTSSALDGDFSTASRYITGTNIKGSDPVIMVVKKHGTVLKELIKWLANSGETLPDGKKLIKDHPLFVIDDEADNASVNISKEGVSTINGLIRSLLTLFQQSSYVGYTATPFANVFIPVPTKEEILVRGLNIRVEDFWRYCGQDIFPRDFILNIPPPSNYIGPREIFGIQAELTDEEESIDGLPIVREIKQEEYTQYIPDKHKKDDPKPDTLPPTLIKAIKSFIITCAIRRVRGQTKVHNSMLVHVTLYVKWQDKIASLIDRALKDYQQQIEFKQGNIIGELKDIWEQDYFPTTQTIKEGFSFDDPFIMQHEWFEIETQLHKAASNIQVRAIHGTKKLEGLTHRNITPLDYYDYRENGLSVIAVGGNKLSRGLTLDGLSISYYLRATKMYDTLMQMGRWFGYRPGYIDLCRIYTSEELIKWYRFITVASEELRSDFEAMKIQRKTPKTFGLKVREHPDVLRITAINKMRHSHEMKLSFSDKLRETWSFSRSPSIISHNYLTTRLFINSLGTPMRKNAQPYVWASKGNYSDVIHFLQKFKAENGIEHTKMIEYIQLQVRFGFLVNWTIVLISNATNIAENLFTIDNESVPVGLPMRSDLNKGEAGKLYELSKSHIIDPIHELIDFDSQDSGYQTALADTIEDWKSSTRKKKRIDPPLVPSGRRIREHRKITDALLLIYPLAPNPKGWEKSTNRLPIIGYAISFPRNEDDKKIIYQVNDVFAKEFDYEEPDDQEMDE